MKLLTKGQEFKNYKELCNYLDEPIKSGKSKQLQLEDWKRFFVSEKQGNKIIIADVYYIPKPKTRKRCDDTSNYGSNNIKNIKPLIDYIHGFLEEDDLYDYHSFTSWYCEILALLDKDLCNVSYQSSDAIEKFCKYNCISSQRLLGEYVYTAKSILKDMFLKSLKYMERKFSFTYYDGFMFTYRIGKKSLGHFNTDELNDLIKENETSICNDMNVEYNLSKKLKGCQNKLVIYGNEELLTDFNERKIDMIMNNEEAINTCNLVIEEDYKHDMNVNIDEEHPLLSYYRGICIHDVDDLYDYDEDFIDSLGLQVCKIIKDKTRKQLKKKHYTNKFTGEIIYPYEDSDYDMKMIEKLLFAYYDEKYFEGIDSEDDGELDNELEELFNNYTIDEVDEEILDKIFGIA